MAGRCTPARWATAAMLRPAYPSSPMSSMAASRIASLGSPSGGRPLTVVAVGGDAERTADLPRRVVDGRADACLLAGERAHDRVGGRDHRVDDAAGHDGEAERDLPVAGVLRRRRQDGEAERADREAAGDEAL